MKAQKALIEVEKYKAIITDPPDPGKVIDKDANFNAFQVGTGISDDDFFHLTCHVDGTLISKIEKGEFVELEKLLPKDKKRKADENRLEWVHQEGYTYLAPVADRMNKINSFRRWEQAFRVYATMHCGANPNHSREVWQYVSVINTATSSFLWENVYEYDTTFRHLMAFNPSRIWAVTYNQMWNICMCDPLPSRSNNFQTRGIGGFQSNQNRSNGSGGNGNNSNSSNHKCKSDYCWNFNKGLVCKYGKKCRFIERCSYCDSDMHGIVKCNKLEKDKKPAEDK